MRHVVRAVFIFVLLDSFCSAVWAHDTGHDRLRPRRIVATATGGTITGHVFDPTGAPVSDVEVELVDATTTKFLDGDVTAADGSYTISGIADGTYYLDAYGDPNNRFLDTWYPDAWDTDFWRGLATPTPIVIANGNTATVDFHLQVGAHIRLTLRDAGGAPITIPPLKTSRGNFFGHGQWGKLFVDRNGTKYEVNAASLGGPELGNGTWEAYAVPVGRTYYLEAWPQGLNYLPVFYDNKPSLESATPIVPTSESPVSITMTLSATGRSIEGKFSFSTPPDQILGSLISLYSTDRIFLQSVNGATDQTYKLGGVADGDYVVKFTVAAKKAGVVTTYIKYYRNTLDFAAATQIHVRGASVTGVDIVMDAAADTTPLNIISFTAAPPVIRSGQTATLSWSTQGATAVSIDNGVGPVAASGLVTVQPTAKTTYTLTAIQGSNSVTSAVTVDVLTTPIINVTSLPNPMLQPANSAGGATSYAVTNSGGAASTITLTQSGSFFTQSPASFTLQPGASQTVTIIGVAQPAGSFEGTSNLSTGLQIPVKLLSAAPPSGTVTADPTSNRVDVASGAATNPTGSVTFTNHGNATLTGILSSDVPWIIPQPGIVTITPGQTVTLTFTIDRTKRPDASALIGSAEGNLFLTFLSGSGSSFAAPWGAAALGGVKPSDTTSTIPSVSLVKIVDTVQPTVTAAGIPALGTGEIALFVSGVGHITGSKGSLFVSDISLLNPQGSKSIDDVKMYYTPSSGSTSTAKSTSLSSVPGQVSVAVADVVKNVFNGNEELGTLHIRSKDADKLVVAASVQTTNNPSGTYGNTIPVLRSDRSIDAPNGLVLTGLRKDATTHTNLYIQETSGSPATIRIDFLSAGGLTVSSRSESIDAFKLLGPPQMFDVVPVNAVAAVITNTSTGGGKIAAYATPVDEASSDTWAIADWSRQLGYPAGDSTIIPVAGSVHGANNTFYRTDLAITNRDSDAANATLRYVSRAGDVTDRQISLGSRQSDIISDVIGTRFNVSGDTAGYLIFTPINGNFAITSRTFTTVGGKPDTFGTGVPVVAAASALKSGGARPIAGLSDANRTTVVAGKPGTFRTNFALMETTGSAVTVRVTFRFTFPAGQKAQGVGSAFRDYALNGNQFLLLNSIAGEILGPARLQFGDLTNVEADFGVISGDGAVVLFTSSIDNATGDSILRTE